MLLLSATKTILGNDSSIAGFHKKMIFFREQLHMPNHNIHLTIAFNMQESGAQPLFSMAKNRSPDSSSNPSSMRFPIIEL